MAYTVQGGYVLDDSRRNRILAALFWIASVYIEGLVFSKWTGCGQELARNWSWKANTLTYGIAVVAVLIWLIVQIVDGGTVGYPPMLLG